MNTEMRAQLALRDALDRQIAALEAVRIHLETGLANLPQIGSHEWRGPARDAAQRLVDELHSEYRGALADVGEAITATRSGYRTLQSHVG